MGAKKDETKSEATKRSGGSGFSAEEREAMAERAAELKKESGGRRSKKDGEADVLEKIAAMPKDEAAIATRIHELVKANAPELAPKTWYGMPAYALDGKVLCFFQGAARFKARYSTLGFNDVANLDDGDMWPTAFAVTKLSAEVEARIVDLLKRAVRPMGG